MELFVLSQLAMQSVYLHRSREALRIADQGLALGSPSPRVEAIFHVRRGRALAQLGADTGSREALTKAQALLASGVTNRDPGWSWWVSDAELAWHEGHAAASLGRRIPAVDMFRQAVDLRPAVRRRGRYNDLAHLLDALVRVSAWEDAEEVVAELRLSDSIDSGRTATLLRQVAARVARTPDAPSSLVDATHGGLGEAA
jgi:hypothetical protein